MDALLAGLSTVAKQAAGELGFYATEEAIIARATKRLSSKSTGFEVILDDFRPFRGLFDPISRSKPAG